MGLNSKFGPVVWGVQWLGRSPIGTNIAPKRRTGAAAVFAVGVRAGTIASSSGRAKVAPRPRNTERRDNDALVMNICWLLPVFGLALLLYRRGPHRVRIGRRSL